MAAASATLAARPDEQARLLTRRPARSRDGLSPPQRRVVIGAIALGHGVALWAVMQMPAVREAVQGAAPVFVELLAARPEPAPTPPAPPPPQTRPVVKAPEKPILAAPAPTPAPAAFEVPAPPPAPPAVATAPQSVEAPSAPPPRPAPAPRLVPASALQYLHAPPPEYPRLSRRQKESGTVLLRVQIDLRGVPSSVEVNRSSGHPRLDDAAIDAVKRWRFKPHTENGQGLASLADIPVIFELEK